jgi:hypothetical protein
MDARQLLAGLQPIVNLRHSGTLTGMLPIDRFVSQDHGFNRDYGGRRSAQHGIATTIFHKQLPSLQRRSYRLPSACEATNDLVRWCRGAAARARSRSEL